VEEIPEAEYVLKRVVLTALRYRLVKSGAGEILVVSQQKICLIYTAKMAYKHRSFTAVIFYLRRRKGIADLVVRHKILHLNTAPYIIADFRVL
jgi:hypothetical protein